MSAKIQLTKSGRLTAGSKRDLAAALRRAHQYPKIYSAAAIRGGESRTARGIEQAITLIPLGQIDAANARHEAAKKHPRAQNWLAPKPAKTNDIFGIEYGTIHYRGAHSGHTGTDYTPTMRAFGRASSDGSILCAILDQPHILPAPRGHKWGKDNNGLRLVRNRDGADLHIDTAHIRAGSKIVAAELSENAARRARTAADAKRDAKILKNASQYGIWVGFGDALKAGNCAAGVRSYAARHGLSLTQYYPAETLPAANEAESRQLALCVLAAQRRTAADLHRGFCDLERVAA